MCVFLKIDFREGNVDVREKHWLVASCTLSNPGWNHTEVRALTESGTGNPLVYGTALLPTEPPGQSYADPFMHVSPPIANVVWAMPWNVTSESPLWRRVWGGDRVQSRGVRKAVETRRKLKKHIFSYKPATSENMFREKKAIPLNYLILMNLLLLFIL